MRIDLNADVGESFGAYRLGEDAALMRSVTSVNIACGFHAGDASVMRETLRLAVKAGVAIGAHPGYPDLQGFGRRDMMMAAHEIEDVVLYQVAALAGVARAEGARVSHVKPHGALYNIAAKQLDVASAIAAAVLAFDRSLSIIGPPGSQLTLAAARVGLRSVAEACADRAYGPDGSLVSRKVPGSVIHDPDAVLQRALQLVRDQTIVAVDGSVIRVGADTLCVHGDTPNSAEIAARLRRGLEQAGVDVRTV